MTPEKVKQSIWRVAEENGLTNVVIGYGVDRVWEIVKEESNDEIFTPVSEICLNVLSELQS